METLMIFLVGLVTGVGCGVVIAAFAAANRRAPEIREEDGDV